MFSIGDHISYPMYGAGTITDIEEKEVMNETHRYYHVSLPFNKMTVLVPIENSERLGVRPIIKPEEMKSVWEVLGGATDTMPTNWNRRYRENMERLSKGDILVTAGVVRNLVRSDRKKKLSAGEKKLLGTAKQILESELSLSAGYTMEEIDALVESHI